MPPTSDLGASIADSASVPGVEKEKDEESEKFVHAVVTVKVSHLSLFLRLLLAMILPRVIRRVSYSCWCGLCGSVGACSIRAWRRVRRQRPACTAHLSHPKQRRYAHHSCVTSHWTAEAEACVSGADGTKLDHCRCILRWNLQARMIRRWDRREGVASTFRAGMR